MLLRIDVFPHNANVDDDDSTRSNDGMPSSPMDPLFACLGTIKDANKGELFTVGRKDSDVVLPSDRSVSRHHLTVSLVWNGGEAIEDRATIQPRNHQEEQACESDPDGMCLVLTDSGRFGTFLVMEQDGAWQAKPSPDEDSDATDGEETEDESQLPRGGGATAASGTSQLSPVTAKLTDSRAALRKLDPNSPLVIPELKDRVIVQCGQNGSTLVIRRIPLVFLWSRLDKSTKDLWTKRLPALGGRALTVADESLTHLVTTERTANTKNLVAWYLQRPNVTTEYLQALWDRRSAGDVMPKEVDCAPTQGSKDDFWNKKPIANLWSGCTYICLLHDDMECLCRAAGANILSLHGMPERQALQKIKDLDAEAEHAFYISTTTSRVAKLVRQLKKQGVPHVTQKALAFCIVKFQRLKDEKGNEIGPPPDDHQMEQDEPLPPIPEHDPEDEEAPASATDNASRNDHTEKELVEPPSLYPIETIPETSRETSEPSIGQMDLDESVDAAASLSDAAGTAEKAGSTSKKRAQESSSSQAESEQPPRQRRKISKDAESMDAEDQSGKSREMEPNKSHEDDEPDDWKEGDEPKKLKVANDGWLVAAPSGKLRKAYRKPINDDDDEEGQEELPPEADTKTCPNLVVGPRNQTNTFSATTTSMGRRSDGKDFKRFRKNRVIKGRNVSRIALRSVLPKESEAERELEERQRALEEEQRAADALFRDAGAGIRSHFKPKRRNR